MQKHQRQVAIWQVNNLCLAGSAYSFVSLLSLREAVPRGRPSKAEVQSWTGLSNDQNQDVDTTICVTMLKCIIHTKKYL